MCRWVYKRRIHTKHCCRSQYTLQRHKCDAGLLDLIGSPAWPRLRPSPLLRSSRGKMEKMRLIMNRSAPLEIGRDAAHTHWTGKASGRGSVWTGRGGTHRRMTSRLFMSLISLFKPRLRGDAASVIPLSFYPANLGPNSESPVHSPQLHHSWC